MKKVTRRWLPFMAILMVFTLLIPSVSVKAETSNVILEEVLAKDETEEGLTIQELIEYVEEKGLNLDGYTLGLTLEGITLEELKAYERAGYSLREAGDDFQIRGHFDVSKVSTEAPKEGEEVEDNGTVYLTREVETWSGDNDKRVQGGVITGYKVGDKANVSFVERATFSTDQKAKDILSVSAKRSIHPFWRIWLYKKGQSLDTKAGINKYRAYCLDCTRAGTSSTNASYTVYNAAAAKKDEPEAIGEVKRNELKYLYYFVDEFGTNSGYEDQLFAQFMTWAIMQESSVYQTMRSNLNTKPSAKTAAGYKALSTTLYEKAKGEGANLETLVGSYMTFLYCDNQYNDATKKAKLAKDIKTLYNNYFVWRCSSSFSEGTNAATIRSNVTLQFYKNANNAYQRLVLYEVKPMPLDITFYKANKATIAALPNTRVKGTCKYGLFADEECTDKKYTITITDGHTDWHLDTDSTKLAARAGGDTFLYLKEISAPPGYKVSNNVIKISPVAILNSSITLVDTPFKARIACTKWDKVTSAKLKGATIELQQSTDGKNGTNWTKVGLMTETSTGTFEWKSTQAGIKDAAAGYIYFTDANQGHFRLVETVAPTNYNLDDPISFQITADNQYFNYNTLATGFVDTPKEINLSIIKVDENTKANLTGAEFTVYEWDASKKAYKTTGTKLTYNSSTKKYEIKNLVISEANGNGKYKVVETKAPNGYENQNWTKEFSGANAGALGVVEYTVPNKPFEIVLNIRKTNALTKHWIAEKATFNIYEWSKASNSYKDAVYKTLTQGAEGLYTGSASYSPDNEGKFMLKEVAAPGNAYLISQEPIYLILDDTITDESGFTYDETTNTYHVKKSATAVISNKIEDTVNPSNDTTTTDTAPTEPTEGGTTDDTSGAMLEGDGTSVDSAVVENGFENKPKEVKLSIKKLNEKDVVLEGAEFGVYAGEIIYDETNKTVLYEKDALIKSGKTDKDGNLSIVLDTIYRDSALYIKEITAPKCYALNDTEFPINVTFKANEDAFVAEPIEVVNVLKPMKVSVVKTDDKTDIPLKGVEFTLYDPDGKELEKMITDENGVANSENEYPLFTLDDEGNVVIAKYYIKETQAIIGYVVEDKTYYLDGSSGEWRSDDQYVFLDIENTSTTVQISKTSATTGTEIKGALLTLYNSNDQVVASWITDGTPLTLDALAPGDYRLVEERAPFGYIVSEEVTFTVTNSAEIQKVEMKDSEAVGKLKIYKYDAADEDQPIEGVTFELRDENGKVIEKLVTDENGYAESSELPFATFGQDGSYENVITYVLVETKEASGYYLDDTERVINFSYINDQTPVIELNGDISNVVKPNKPKLPTPGTGESIVFIILFVIALATGIGSILYFKKRKSTNDVLGRH